MAYRGRRAAAAVAVILIATVLVGGDTAPAPTVAAPGQTVAAGGRAMDAYLSKLADDKGFRGSVLVARGTDVLLSKGYDLADRSTGSLNTPHTRFRIGSVGKQFTALAILKLQELGKLKVTDRVCQHVTPCPAAWKTVTVEHLLVHTSGIPDNTKFAEYLSFSTTTLSPEQLVGLFRDKPLDFPPGSQWLYSNSGYAVLGYLIERVTGGSFAEFLHRQILDPLGLPDTGYDVNHPTGKAHAIGYTGWYSPARFIDMSVVYAAGALYSSVSGMYRWNRFLLTGTPTIVQAGTLAAMFTPRVPTDPAAPDQPWYGYGVGSRRSRRDLHTQRPHRRIHLSQPDQAPRSTVDHRPVQHGQRRHRLHRLESRCDGQPLTPDRQTIRTITLRRSAECHASTGTTVSPINRSRTNGSTTCGDKFLYVFKGGPAGPPRPPPQVRPASPCRFAHGLPARLGANQRRAALKPAETQPTAGGPRDSLASCLAPQLSWAGAPPAGKPRVKRLRRGRSGSRMGGAIPSADDPGEPSRPPPGAPAAVEGARQR